MSTRISNDPLKLYPVWSNGLYFVSGIYAIILGIFQNFFNKKFVYTSEFKFSSSKNIQKYFNKHNAAFIFLGLLIIGAGISSIFYHLHTPSWYGFDIPRDDYEDEYKKLLALDMTFAIASIVFASFFLVERGFHSRCFFKNVFKDPNLYMTILCIALSITFFFIAGNHSHSASECNNKKCFDKDIDVYDIFHSNWHIFAAFGSIFWINLLKNTYLW